MSLPSRELEELNSRVGAEVELSLLRAVAHIRAALGELDGLESLPVLGSGLSARIRTLQTKLEDTHTSFGGAFETLRESWPEEDPEDEQHVEHGRDPIEGEQD